MVARIRPRTQGSERVNNRSRRKQILFLIIPALLSGFRDSGKQKLHLSDPRAICVYTYGDDYLWTAELSLSRQTELLLKEKHNADFFFFIIATTEKAKS